jgi:hypothetical protein
VSLRRIVLADDAVGAWVTTERGRRPAEPGEALGFHAFADALRPHVSVPVDVSHRLPAPDGDGTAVIVPAGMLREVAGRPDLARGAILAAAVRTTVLETLERHRLAGGVERATWSAWRAGEAPSGSVIGRVEVGEAMGAEAERQAPWASEHYAPLASTEHPGLPAILAAYLQAYFENPPPD